MPNHKKTRGFTLIELMVTVAIVAILAAIAFPSYQQHIRKTRVGQAKEGAMQIATVLERQAASDNKYPNAGTNNTPPSDVLQPYSSSNTGGAYMSYIYTPTATNDNYTLQASDTASLGIRVWINSQGTRCFCDGNACNSGSLTAAATSCSSGTAF